MATFNINILKSGSAFLKDLSLFNGASNTIPQVEQDLINLEFFRNIENFLESEEDDKVLIETLIRPGFNYYVFAIPNSATVTSIKDLSNLSEELVDNYINSVNINVIVNTENVLYNVYVLSPNRSYLDQTTHLLTIEKL